MQHKFEIISSNMLTREKEWYFGTNYCLINFRIKKGKKNIDLKMVYSFDADDVYEYLDQDTISKEDLEYVKDEFVYSEIECLCSNKLGYIIGYCDNTIFEWNDRHGCYKFWPYPNSLGKLIADEAYIEPNDIDEEAA